MSCEGSAGLPASGEIAMGCSLSIIRPKLNPKSESTLLTPEPKIYMLAHVSPSWPLLHSTGHRFTFQMSAAYSAIVRSLENFPEPATFKIALRDHPTESAQSSHSCWSASK